MKDRYAAFLAWAKQNERHIATGVFVFGFLSDIATYILIPVSVANLLFVLYLALSALCTIGSHYLAAHEPPVDLKPHWLRRTLDVLLPLGAQYFLGGLLSGFLIFYTKSAVLLVSWPFLLFLLIVFLGNEIFRDYRAHLAFQTILLFFSFYAFSIFTLPILVHTLGPVIFLESTASSIGALALFLGILAMVGWSRFKNSLVIILGGVALITLVVVGSYFTNLIPPIPLTLADSGVYHSVTHTEGGYMVGAETEKPWWQFWQSQTIHHVAGTPLYAYSAVFAPVAFSTGVEHEWQWHNPQTKKWESRATIIFPISGGRKEGYRGYSEITDVPAGQWRVYVKTPNDQVIGRIDFLVENAAIEPELTSEIK